MEKVGDVMMSYDYKQFVLDEVNRPIDEHNLSRIVQSMRKNFLITVSLVIRKGKKLIIWDGQHRLKACEALEKPYYFTIIDDLTACKLESNNETLATLQNTKSWRPSDYVHYYTKQNNGEYQLLSDFMQEYDLPCISAVICLTGKIGISLPRTFKLGNFKVKNLNMAHHFAQILQEFRKVGYGSATNPKFVSALFTGLNMHNINVKKLLTGLEVNPSLRLLAGSTRDTLENMKAYSLKDKPINKQFVEFKNDWPF